MTGDKIGEFRGKTVEAAINAGLIALQISREDVEIEVIKQGSRGVLGIGAEDAVVRLTAKHAGRPEPAAPPASTPVGKPEAKPGPDIKSMPAAGSKAEVEPYAKPYGEVAKGARSARNAPVKAPSFTGAEDKALGAVQMGREYLAGLLERMSLRADIQITEQSEAEADEGEQVHVLNIVGDDLGVLIGRQNEVLSSLEFITRLMVNQHSRARSNFVVDVNGYRAKRADSLRKLALRTAEQVAGNNRTMALEPMPPAERRIIHLTLRDHPKVFTQSVGEGDHRKVTIVPKKE